MSLSAFRIVEDEIEGIHRRVKVESSRAAASRVPWVSATRTCEIDIAYVQSAAELPGGEELVCKEWDAYKRILQKPGARARTLLQPRTLSGGEGGKR